MPPGAVPTRARPTAHEHPPACPQAVPTQELTRFGKNKTLHLSRFFLGSPALAAGAGQSPAARITSCTGPARRGPCKPPMLDELKTVAAELRSLAGDTGEAARQITLLATMLTAFVARHEPQSAFKLPPRQEWRAGSVVPAGLSSVEPWK